MPRADELIKKNVTDELVRDTRVDASKVHIEVDKGTVLLKGEVPSYLAKAAAAEDALSVLGVIDIKNHLLVRYPPTVTVPPDTEIESAIRTKLAANPDIDLLDLNVTVTAGEVTLRGTVDAFWKKGYAEMLVETEPGVTFINNHLAVVPSDDVVDQDIANDIVYSLETRAAVDAENVDVSVVNGIVTLTGEVFDWSARRSAEDAAVHTAGVVRVDNNLAVAAL